MISSAHASGLCSSCPARIATAMSLSLVLGACAPTASWSDGGVRSWMLERAPLGTSYERTVGVLKDKGFTVSSEGESPSPPRDCRVWLYDGPVKRTFIAMISFSVKQKIVVFHFDEADSLRDLSMTTQWVGP